MSEIGRSAQNIREAMKALNLGCRAIWEGGDGRLRCGHSGDVVTMLDDLGIPTISAGRVTMASSRC